MPRRWQCVPQIGSAIRGPRHGGALVKRLSPHRARSRLGLQLDRVRRSVRHDLGRTPRRSPTSSHSDYGARDRRRAARRTAARSRCSATDPPGYSTLDVRSQGLDHVGQRASGSASTRSTRSSVAADPDRRRRGQESRSSRRGSTARSSSYTEPRPCSTDTQLSVQQAPDAATFGGGKILVGATAPVTTPPVPAPNLFVLNPTTGASSRAS